MAGTATDGVATRWANSAASDTATSKVSIRMCATARDTEMVPGQMRVLVPQSNHSRQGSNWNLREGPYTTGYAANAEEAARAVPSHKSGAQKRAQAAKALTGNGENPH